MKENTSERKREIPRVRLELTSPALLTNYRALPIHCANMYSFIFIFGANAKHTSIGKERNKFFSQHKNTVIQ